VFYALARVVRSDASCIMWQDRQGYLFFYFVKDLCFPLTSHDNCHCKPQPCSPTYVRINDKTDISDCKEILHSPAQAPHYLSPHEGPGQGSQPSCRRRCCSCSAAGPALKVTCHSHVSKQIGFCFPAGIRNQNAF